MEIIETYNFDDFSAEIAIPKGYFHIDITIDGNNPNYCDLDYLRNKVLLDIKKIDHDKQIEKMVLYKGKDDCICWLMFKSYEFGLNAIKILRSGRH